MEMILGRIRIFIGGRLYLVAVNLFFVYLIAGCGSSKNDAAKAQQTKFEVIDSLLGPKFEIPNSGKSINPPVNFAALPDSILEGLKAQVKESVGDSEGIELQQFFIDEPRSAGLMISTIKGLNLSSDTTVFVGRYRKAVSEAFGLPNIKSDNYWIGDIYVLNFLIMDSVNVKYQLLCMSKTNDGVELQFFASQQLYPQLIKRFESSIGSMKLTKKEG
jgi:hypothetical protein